MKNNSSNYKYAFIVHSRDRSDLPRKYPFLKFLPNLLFDFLTLHLPPIVVSNITGLRDRDGKSIDGIVIGIPMTARQMLENKTYALKKIVKAVEYGKKKGALYFGLGAMTGSLSAGGLNVIERVKQVYITNGRTYTAKNIADYVDYCLERFRISSEKVRIAIVGAAGGVGSSVAILLAKKRIKNFTLIDLERKLIHVKKNIESIKNNNSDLTVKISHKIDEISNCDVVIAATSAPEVVIKSEDVQPGTILINDAQPSDISPDIVLKRKDVLVIEGGVLIAPNIDCHFNFGLADKSNIFSCLAETILISYMNICDHLSLGNLSIKRLEELSESSRALGFEIGRPQNSSGYITDEDLKEFGKIILKRQSTQ